MSRPILPWRSPLVIQAPSGAAVWIRRLPWYDTPVRAVSDGTNGYQLSLGLAVPDDTPELIPIPLYVVHSWKFQFLADEQAAFPPS